MIFVFKRQQPQLKDINSTIKKTKTVTRQASKQASKQQIIPHTKDIKLLLNLKKTSHYCCILIKIK